MSQENVEICAPILRRLFETGEPSFWGLEKPRSRSATMTFQMQALDSGRRGQRTGCTTGRRPSATTEVDFERLVDAGDRVVSLFGCGPPVAVAGLASSASDAIVSTFRRRARSRGSSTTTTRLRPSKPWGCRSKTLQPRNPALVWARFDPSSGPPGRAAIHKTTGLAYGRNGGRDGQTPTPEGFERRSLRGFRCGDGRTVR